MHIKGIRFGFPPITRLGVLDDRKAHIVRWNSHSGCEIHFMLRGHFTWGIKDSGHRERKVSVSGGSFVVIPPKVQHRADESMGNPSSRIGVICEPPDMIDWGGCRCAFSKEELASVYARIAAGAPKTRRIPPPLMRVLKDIRRDASAFKATDEGGHLHLRILCELMLSETARACDNADGNSFATDDESGPVVVQRVGEWIREHYAEPISNERLVKLAGYGKSRFFTLFFAETGLTPHSFLLRVRLQNAKRMLRESRWTPVDKIAAAVGFDSPLTFASAFKRYFGVRPDAWRRRNPKG